MSNEWIMSALAPDTDNGLGLYNTSLLFVLMWPKFLEIVYNLDDNNDL